MSHIPISTVSGMDSTVGIAKQASFTQLVLEQVGAAGTAGASAGSSDRGVSNFNGNPTREDFGVTKLRQPECTTRMSERQMNRATMGTAQTN